MNMRNMRLQEANRIKNTVQHQLRLNQTHDTVGASANGYRSLGFYQAGRYTGGSGNGMVVGSRSGSGNLVS